MAQNAENHLHPGRELLAVFAIVAVVLGVYWRAVGFAILQWDDQLHLTGNPFIQPGTPGRYSHFWLAPYQKLYIPVAYNAWGFISGLRVHGDQFSPMLLHLVNVILHAVCGLLVFWLLRILIGNVLPAAFGAMLFVLHPIQVESVAWISEFRGLSATALALGAMIFYFLSVGRKNLSGRIAFQGVGILFLCAGFLCKPGVVAVPFLMGVIEWVLLARPWKNVSSRLAPWLVVSIAGIAFARIVQPAAAGIYSPVSIRPMVAGDALAFYLGKLLVPFWLCADYSRTPEMARETIWFWWASAVPLIIAAILFWRRWRMAGASFLVFVLALAPVLGLVPFEFQRISTVADRYAYLAMLGPAMLLAWAMRSSGRSPWRLKIGFASLLLILLGARSIDQLSSWRDDQSLWQHAIDLNPRSVVAASNLAQQAADRGDVGTARRLFLEAIKYGPHRANAFVGLAKIARDQRDFSEAEKWYRAAMNADPTDAIAYNDLGSMLAIQGRTGEAEWLMLKAMEVDPEYSGAKKNLLVLLNQLARQSMQQRDWSGAELLERRILAIEPADISALNDLGQVLAAEGKVDEAITVFEKAVKLHPEIAACRENLASARQLKKMTAN